VSGVVICEAFDALADLCVALGEAPLTKHAGLWERQVDERWHIAVNGHTEEHPTAEGFPVPPFCCAVKFNGWPAGLFDPTGGVIAAGEGANETTFIAALRAATVKATGKAL